MDAPLSIELLESRRQQLISSSDIAAPLRDSLVKIYESILAELKNRAESERVAKESSAKAEAAPAAIAEAKRRKETPPKFEPLSPFTLRNSRQENLQSMLQQQQSALATTYRRQNLN